jgi:hypothetical protein
LSEVNVATPSREYKEHSQHWILPRALMGGTVAMRDASTAHGFLPQEDGESDPNFAKRLARTTLFNGYRKTVRDMTGKVFAQPIALGDDVPEKIKGYCENIDLAGRNLNVFAYDVFQDGLAAAGVSYILAEMPPVVENATRADEIASGRRPYLVNIKAEDIIGWKSELIAGQETLTQLRIQECVYEPDPDSPFEDVEIVQIRVLEPGRWEIWRKRANENGLPEEWFMYQEGVTSLSHIPLSVVYLKRSEFMCGEPPLEDLAYTNLAHWQSQSDQRNILHVARVPILFGAGFDDTTKVVVGAGTMARSSDPAAKLTYVEHSGAAIEAGRNDLKDLELQMQVLGLQLLMPQPKQTATGEIRDDVKENSQLAMMAKALEDALEQALSDMAEYDGMGKDAGGSLVVNTDFGIAAGATADLDTLINAARISKITNETLLKELKRRGVLSDDLVIEDEVKGIEAAKQRDAELAEKIAQTANPGAALTEAAA